MKWFLLVYSSCFAAGPLMHLALADRWCSANVVEDREAFMKGSTFPDIRYLSHTPREKTHYVGVSIAEIKSALGSFNAGMLHHCYVDEKREALVLEYGIYELLGDQGRGHNATLLKFVEDEILFSRGELYYSYFANEIFEEERLEPNYAGDWNRMLSWYLYLRPSFILGWSGWYGKSLLGISPEILVEWGEVVPIFARDPRIEAHVDRLLSFFCEKV